MNTAKTTTDITAAHVIVQCNYHQGPVYARLISCAAPARVCLTHVGEKCGVCVVNVSFGVCAHTLQTCVLTRRVHMSACGSVTHIVSSKHCRLVAMADSFNKGKTQIFFFPFLPPLFPLTHLFVTAFLSLLFYSSFFLL